jgi:PAS domain S-box-containing protein
MTMNTYSQISQDIGGQTAYTKALFESIGDGVIVTDERGIIRQINNVALEMLKVDRSEALGKWFPKIVRAQNEKGLPIPTINRPITKAFLAGKAISEKLFYAVGEGERIAVDITVSPIVLDGEPVGAIEIMRDITKDKEIDQLKTDFIGIASHQLRTPLTALKTYTHILEGELEGKINNKAKNHLNVIHNSILRMNEIISMLLNISRIEAGLLKVRIKEVNVSKLAIDLARELNSLAIEKNITMSCKMNKDIYEKTDPIIFAEILSNLISNAIKYTPAGGRVIIALETNHRTRVSVSDSGVGIPKHLHSKIFTKFFRTPIAAQTDVSGNGLGLYMAKQMTQALKGDIYFDSAEDKGSTFYFTFPKRQA